MIYQEPYINMLKVILTLLLSIVCFGCTSKVPPDLKSPCVAIESNDKAAAAPCVRRKVNDNWLG
jgi:hypothetical protein